MFLSQLLRFASELKSTQWKILYDAESESESKQQMRATKNAHVVTTLEEAEINSFEDCSTQQMNVPLSL